MNFFRRFYLLTYIAIEINNSSFASTAEYVEKMNSVGIRLSGARFLYKSPKKELWVDFSTDSTNYFLKYAPHVKELLVEDSVSADLQIRCKTKDGYWEDVTWTNHYKIQQFFATQLPYYKEIEEKHQPKYELA